MFVAVSITETLSLALFGTYTFVASGLTATPTGPVPTGIVAITVSLAMSITETVLLASFVTYANLVVLFICIIPVLLSVT